ncbi:MAG: hypothetical protein O3C62_00200 [Actinomycetota bacterium]|nr:hypothetical protein [Actinomycetota bacterium]MDA2970930.1 hypothetical protein [Actinomycetota bacterium]MDA3000084.1 hypothetical protein [Actinomycetota bacterium]
MAADDEMIDDDDLDEDGFIEEDGDDDLELDADALDDDGEIDDEMGDDEEDDDMGDEAGDDDGDGATPTVRAKRGSEDDDEDLTTADDVEADLAHILDERLRERSEVDEDDEEEEEPPSAADPETSIQPKRADERMCPQCFLLVRKGAPVCPVGDDDCPLFS